MKKSVFKSFLFFVLFFSIFSVANLLLPSSANAETPPPAPPENDSPLAPICNMTVSNESPSISLSESPEIPATNVTNGLAYWPLNVTLSGQALQAFQACGPDARLGVSTRSQNALGLRVWNGPTEMNIGTNNTFDIFLTSARLDAEPSIITIDIELSSGGLCATGRPICRRTYFKGDSSRDETLCQDVFNTLVPPNAAYPMGENFQYTIPADKWAELSESCGSSFVDVVVSHGDRAELVERASLSQQSPTFSALLEYPETHNMFLRTGNGDGALIFQFCVYDPSTSTSCSIDPIVEPTETQKDYSLCAQVPSDNNQRDACCSCVTGNSRCEGSTKVEGVWTAIGCIETDPTKMTATIMKVALSVAGGVTILVILGAGFLFSTSQGDPKRTSEAKEMMTSAVVGLLFIIFSVTILTFIGVDILQIPGFGTP